MSRNYLFGPVRKTFAAENLASLRAGGQCLCFNEAGDLDVRIGPEATWETVAKTVSRSGKPSFLVLYLPYTTIPPLLRQAPIPIIGLAPDWSMLWHYYRIVLSSQLSALSQ